ncbi:MAG: LamG-like jellyroll fold domain-containing protein [Planctomycetota bacterium]
MCRADFIACVGVAVLFALAVHAQDPKALLGHWTFDAGQGDLAADQSGRGNDADISDADWVKGPFGTALRFKGEGSCVTVSELSDLNGSDELTVEAWVLWEGTGRYPNILTGGQWSPGGFMIFVSDNQCSFRIGRPGASARDPQSGWKEGGAQFLASLELNRWYHLAATLKRPNITTYVDGKPVGKATWDFPVGYSGDIVIGRWGGAKASHNGLIDDVKIYNRCLTPEEVQAGYTNAAPRHPVQLAAGEKAYEAIPQTGDRGPALAAIETASAKLEIDQRGRCIALIDKKTGKNRLDRSTALVGLKAAGKTLRLSRCSYADGKLTIKFGKDEAALVLGMTAKDRYVVFEVLSLDGQDVEEVTFVSLQVQPAEHVNPMSNLAADDEFAVCLRALNAQTRAWGGRRPPILSAMAYREYGFVGCKAALVACPTDQVRDVLKEVVKQEGLPYSALGGPWALDAEDTRGSYLFSNVSEDNVDEWIDMAKRAGFTHVHFSGWSKTLGHYEPRETVFPNGLEGMKKCVQKIHAAGLKAGMHTLTGCIAINDSWVTPVPDARLAADASYTLAEAMDEKSMTMRTVEKPQRHDTVLTYASGGNVIRIGQELIQYSAISYDPPYGFLNCTRGALKTTPAAHPKDAKADHLRQRYMAFYPDEKSTLVGEVADCIATVFNTCEMDEIYMDGAEGMGTWYGISVMRQAIYDRLKRPALVEASCWDHHSWPFHSRIGAWDHPKWGLKRFHDMHIADIPGYRKGGLLQAQLGWWVVNGPTGYSPSETPDEMEYFCCKTFAHDAPISIQGVYAGARPANARQDEYLAMTGRYERLRLSRYFSDAVIEQLREPGKDFHLVQADDGEWQFLPTDYIKHKITGLEDGANTWTVQNRFDAQPLRLRIQALYAALPYESADAKVITDFADVKPFTVHRNGPGVSHIFETSTDQVKAGTASVRFTAANKGNAREGAWAHAGMRFEPMLDMRPCYGIGLWVHGDGKGEVLNIQFVTPPVYMHCYSEHYITIDFTGWRYFQIPIRERDADRYHDYKWPYFSQHGIFRTALDAAHIDELNLYLNNLPPNDTAAIYLSPIKALPVKRVALKNPTIEINGQKLAFPITLQSESLIEFDGMADCRVYDDRYALLESLELPGQAPTLAAGENKLTFTAQPQEGFPVRASVTVVASGPPLRGRNAPDKVDTKRLQDECELPREILTLDGKQNQWPVLCRADAKGARIEMEVKVHEIGASDEAYNAPSALSIESFDDLSFFADSPENDYVKFVYDSTYKALSTKPGVTQSFERSEDVVKVGKSSARYTAASTLDDPSGWSAKGRRFKEPIDLSGHRAIGFWLYGDAKGEAFKLQLRDNERKWHDMVTHVNFDGWKYVEFDITQAKLDRSKIEYIIIFFNGIPAKQTVTCHVDDIRAVKDTFGLHDPELTVGGRRIVMPCELAEGDRLVFKGMDGCRLYRKGQAAPETIAPQGEAPRLSPGKTPVVFGLGPTSPKRFRVTVGLAKIYE